MDKGANVNDQNSIEAAAIAFACPVCKLSNPPNASVCLRCGTIFQTLTSTVQLDIAEDATRSTIHPVGQLPTSESPIILEVGSDQILVPSAEHIVLGRGTGTNNLESNVSLDAYHAQQHGVSRHHVKLERKNLLIFVSDLSSTNGTWLNGQRLPPNTPRLLRSGDELRLGTLTVHIKF